MEPGLKPCPFCGKKTDLEVRTWFNRSYAVHCICGTVVPSSCYPNQAKDAWNDRKPEKDNE